MNIRLIKKLKNYLSNKILLRNLLVLTPIIVSLISLTISVQANNIALSAWNLGKENLGFELDKTSRQYVKAAFDDLYTNSQKKQIMIDLKQNKIIYDNNDLKSVVDIFEEVGSDFCQGTSKLRHIRIYLKNSLDVICNNKEINDNFSGKKNGVAILCAELLPNSLFAKSLNKENIGTCEFFDSTQFPQMQNRYKFEYK